MLIVGRTKYEIFLRKKAIRSDFYKRYDLEKLREQKFREQGGICAVCGEPLQDSCGAFTSIDHAISVTTYAQFRQPIDWAIEFCNNPRNLLALHKVCNTKKGAADYEDFMNNVADGKFTLNRSKLPSSDKIETIKIAYNEMIRKTADKRKARSMSAGAIRVRRFRAIAALQTEAESITTRMLRPYEGHVSTGEKKDRTFRRNLGFRDRLERIRFEIDALKQQSVCGRRRRRKSSPRRAPTWIADDKSFAKYVRKIHKMRVAKCASLTDFLFSKTLRDREVLVDYFLNRLSYWEIWRKHTLPSDTRQSDESYHLPGRFRPDKKTGIKPLQRYVRSLVGEGNKAFAPEDACSA